MPVNGRAARDRLQLDNGRSIVTQNLMRTDSALGLAQSRVLYV